MPSKKDKMTFDRLSVSAAILELTSPPLLDNGSIRMAEAPPEETIEGLFPIFFTSASQEIFGCKVDVNVTPENPQKLVPLEVIIKDFKDRAAVSDFHPCKAQMQVHQLALILSFFFLQ